MFHFLHYERKGLELQEYKLPKSNKEQDWAPAPTLHSESIQDQLSGNRMGNAVFLALDILLVTTVGSALVSLKC